MKYAICEELYNFLRGEFDKQPYGVINIWAKMLNEAELVPEVENAESDTEL